MTASYHYKPEYLMVRVTGEWTELAANRLIDAIRDEAEKTGASRLLLDLVEVIPPSADSVRYQSGIKIAETLFKYKVAGFSQPKKINRLGEITATNRGANFRMFDSEDEAVAWLLE